MTNSEPHSGRFRQRRRDPIAWFRALMDRLFGYDYFISYAHADGANYPRQLRDRLEQMGFRAFLDTVGYDAGDDLRVGTRRRVRMSTYLLVIARPHALRSMWVLREIQAYLGKGRTPIVVNINGALEDHSPGQIAPTEPEESPDARNIKANITRLLSDRLYISETLDELDGKPSDRVLEQLQRRFSATRQESRRLRFLGCVAATLAVLVVAATSFAVVAFLQTRVANQRRQATMGLAAGALARDPSQGMDALALSIEAIGGQSERNVPPEVTVGLVAALSAARESIPIQGIDGSRLQKAMLLPDGRGILTVDQAGALRLWDHGGAPKSQLRAPAGPTSNNVCRVAPDGKTVLIASGTTTDIVDLASGEMRARLVGHERPIVSANYSPKSDRVVTGDGSGVFIAWDLASGRPQWTVPKQNDEAKMAVFSSDGNLLLTVAGRDIRFWDLERKECKAAWRGEPLAPIFSVEAAVLSPDSKKALIVGTRTIILWNTETGEPIQKHWLPNCDTALAADCSRDEFTALMAQGKSPYDGTVELYNAQTGAVLSRLDHSWRCTVAAFATGGDWAVTGGEDRVVRVWRRDPRTATWSPAATLAGHEQSIHSAAISAKSGHVLSLDHGGVARLWNLKADQSLLTIEPPGGVSFAAFSLGGTHLISLDQQDWVLRCWRAQTGDKAWVRLIKPGSRATVSPNGTRIVVTNTQGEATLYDAADGIPLQKFPVRVAPFQVAKFSRDSQRVAFVCDESGRRSVTICDLRGSQLARVDAPAAMSTAIALSPSGDRLVVCSDELVKLYEVDSETAFDLPHRSKTARFLAAEFSPDGGRIVAACLDSTATLWDSKRKTALNRLEKHSNAVIGTHFSPDGTRIVTVGEDGHACLWDGITGQFQRSLSGQTMMLTDAVFAPDGRMVLACSRDGTARLWDANTGELLGFFGRRFDTEATLGSFSPDGATFLVVRRSPSAERSAAVGSCIKVYPATFPQFLDMAASLLRHQPQWARVQDILGDRPATDATERTAAPP